MWVLTTVREIQQKHAAQALAELEKLKAKLAASEEEAAAAAHCLAPLVVPNGPLQKNSILTDWGKRYALALLLGSVASLSGRPTDSLLGRFAPDTPAW